MALALAGCEPVPAVVTEVGPVDAGPTDRSPTDLPDSGSADLAPAGSAARGLYAEVNAYLAAEDPGPHPAILDRLDTVYRDVPFATVLDAVTRRPPRAPLPTGVSQHSWVNPLYEGTETYQLYVPATLAASPAPALPLLIFLHGAGGSGAGIVGSQPVREAADRLGVLLVAPTSNPSCDWSALEDCMSQVVLLVQHLKRRFPVDDARVVLSGFSMGGRGAFSVGVAYPEPYCGVVPVAGSIGAVHNTSDLAVHKAYCCPHVENLTNLRLHYISGDQDMQLMLYQNRGCELCLEEQGSEYVYTELAGQGHVWPLDLWEKAVAWTLARPRVPYPARVVYNIARQASAIVPEDIFLQQTLRTPQYWADIETRRDPELPARIEARRAGNLITLDSTNVARFSLFLAPGMVDLREEVRVLHEREGTLFEGMVSPDRRLLLTEARRRAERSMVFANRLILAIPGTL